MVASAASGTINAPIDGIASDTGRMPAIRKKARPAIQIDSDVSAVLNAVFFQEYLRRHETRKLSTATVTVAGAGPKSRTDAMKNVSVTDTIVGIDANCIVKQPAPTANPAKRSHSSGRGVLGS